MNFGFMVQHSNESQRNASKHFSFLFWKYDDRVWEPGRGQKRFRLIFLFVYSCQYNGWLVLLVSVMRFCFHNTTLASWRFQWWFEWVSNVCLFKLCLVITKRANQTVSSALSKRPSQHRTSSARLVTCGSAHTICLWSLFKLCQGGKQADNNCRGMLASVVIMFESYPVSLKCLINLTIQVDTKLLLHLPPWTVLLVKCSSSLCCVMFLLWVRLLSCDTFTPIQTWFLI